MYNTGTHVKKDPATAAAWLRKAAASGHADAAFNLAYLYSTGSGVEQSNQLAHQHLVLAAHNGHSVALKYVHKFLASKGLDENGTPLG
jgi:TPR repeat protein